SVVVDEEIRDQEEHRDDHAGGQIPKAEDRDEQVHERQVCGETRPHGQEIARPLERRGGERRAERDQLLKPEAHGGEREKRDQGGDEVVKGKDGSEQQETRQMQQGTPPADGGVGQEFHCKPCARSRISCCMRSTASASSGPMSGGSTPARAASAKRRNTSALPYESVPAR